MFRWQLQEAKQRFSEVVRRAQAEGPQIVTRHGVDMVAIIDIEKFRHLTGEVPDFKNFLTSSPDFDDLDLERSREPAPAVELAAES